MSAQDRKELLIIIPAHNEEENIQKVFDRLEEEKIAKTADILVINDASTDHTGEVIRKRGYSSITDSFRLGYGGALQQGYRYAVQHGYSWIIQMDADGQHDVCNIPVIYRRLREKDADGRTPDIVLASRYMEGSSAFRISVWKKMAYGLFRLIIQGVTGRRIADPTTGLQGLNRRTFFFYAKSSHYNRYPDANIVIQMLLLGFRIVEIPAVMHVRTDGRSMHHGIGAVRYMVCMLCSIVKVVFRIKVLKNFRIQRSRPLGKVKTHAVRFQESARKLDNPGRGFCSVWDFRITDETLIDSRLVADRCKKDPDTSLALILISLENYTDGAISEIGLENLKALFLALKMTGKQLIVRFVYDRDGKCLQYEPGDIRIILLHMRQLEPLFREYRRQIFTLQGLFVGNWGEMHGTRYDSMESLRRLALQLAEVTDESTYLAVRTPAQWRMITRITRLRTGGSAYVPEHTGNETGKNLENRLGLFHDGMLGNETDYGTYGMQASGQTGVYDKWSREEELRFQSELCSRVPNGGEVICPNTYNDLDSAAAHMKRMHVTYLNREYDRRVLEKWAKSEIREKGCFDGVNGYIYMERHLGYRLFIDRTDLVCRLRRNRLKVCIVLKNAGFAPLYREPEVELRFCGQAENVIHRQKIVCSLRGLTGGDETGKEQKIRTELNLSGIQPGKYQLYLAVTDSASGRRIQLANEQEEETYGYRIGEVEIR